jgi:aromatic ring-cleaving dioxygenase
VIRAGQETYSNGEMNQAISESVIHGDRRARKQEEKTRSEIGTGRRKQTRLGIKQDKKIGFEDKNTMILMMANQSKGKKVLWCPCWG